MIAKGNLHANGGKLAVYMTTGKEGERAELIELRGFASDDIRTAFLDVEIQAYGTHSTKPFFHAYTRLAPGEALTREQWLQVADREEKRLGFAGQPRAVSFHHQRDGATHMHIAWSRIDTGQSRAIDPGLYKNKLKELCRALEKQLDLTPVRNERAPDDTTRSAGRNEFEQARRLNTDLKTIRGTIRDCWEQSDNGKSFAAALDAHGLILARGDKRDFVVIDHAGGDHALSKRITDATAAQTRSRLADIDPAQLPSVDQAKAQQHVREASREARQAERAGIELAAERAMQEARAAAQGRTDDVRPVFEAAAARATEPAAPVYDRDSDNAAWEAKLAEAAINADAQKGQQQPAANAGRTRAGAGEPSSGPENSQEASANQNTHQPLTHEVMQRDPWQAVYAPVPNDADRTLLAAAAFAAAQCERYAFAAARVSAVIEPELAGYYRDRQADAAARRDEANQRLAVLSPDQVAQVSPFLHPEQIYERAQGQLEHEIWQRSGAWKGGISAERMDANPWSIVSDRTIPPNASADLLQRINATGFQLSNEAWDRRETAFTPEEAKLWNDYGQIAREVAKDAGFELAKRLEPGLVAEVEGETREARQRPGDSDPEIRPEASAELWDELSAWSADARPDRADKIEMPSAPRGADVPADQPAHDIFDGIEEALHAGTRAASGAASRLAKAVENVLGGIFSFFGAAEPKLTPMQAELAARANDELAEARAAAAASREKEAAQDWMIFQQDRQQQQDDLDIETGRRERPGDRERERERDWP
jgi:Relaxase/Mobilisation nuclease domain